MGRSRAALHKYFQLVVNYVSQTHHIWEAISGNASLLRRTTQRMLGLILFLGTDINLSFHGTSVISQNYQNWDSLLYQLGESAMEYMGTDQTISAPW